MRILHLIYDDMGNPWCGGGGSVRAYEINRRLAQKHEITVVTGNYPGVELEERREGILYRRMGCGRSHFLSRLTFALSAPRILKTFDYDLAVNDFSVYAPCLAPLLTRRPVVTSLLSYVSWHAMRKYPIVGIIPLIAEQVVLRLSYYIIVDCRAIEETIRWKVPSGASIQCVHNGISDHLFQERQGEVDLFILYFGRLDLYTKGLDILIRAFAQLSSEFPQVRMKMAGGGKSRDVGRIRSLIDEMSLRDKVDLLGFVSEAEKLDLLARCMFLCIPSRYDYTPIVAFEAAASGKAIIATNTSSLGEAIGDGEIGLEVASENVQELVEAMVFLLKSPAERERLGANGRRWVRGFTWDNVAEQQAAFYSQVWENHRSGN